MNEFLTAIGYMHWVLPVLLAIPTVGAIVIWLQGLPGRGAPGEDDVASGIAAPPRTMAFITFLAEFIVSLGLWWSYD
ncbi:MAG: hypothetical protein ACREN3_09005, partial [Gemmatimonadaceae bacterium]